MRPTKVIKERTFWSKCLRLKPSVARIRENSLIWATVKPARKLVLRLWPKRFMIIITIIGLQMRTKTERSKAFGKRVLRFSKCVCEPSNKKKIIRKKSRNGLSFEDISKETGLVERQTPAIKEPISTEKPSK